MREGSGPFPGAPHTSPRDRRTAGPGRLLAPQQSVHLGTALTSSEGPQTLIRSPVLIQAQRGPGAWGWSWPSRSRSAHLQEGPLAPQLIPLPGRSGFPQLRPCFPRAERPTKVLSGLS